MYFADLGCHFSVLGLFHVDWLIPYMYRQIDVSTSHNPVKNNY